MVLDLFMENSVFFVNILRGILFLIFAYEIYQNTRKGKGLETIYSWKTEPMKEARRNIVMVAAILAIFIITIYWDTKNTYWMIYVPLDILLLALMEAIFLMPKYASISKQGVFYNGTMVEWGDVLDTIIDEKADILILRRARGIFSRDIFVPLPKYVDELEDALAEAKGEKKKKGKKKPGKNKDEEDEDKKGKDKEGEEEEGEVEPKKKRSSKTKSEPKVSGETKSPLIRSESQGDPVDQPALEDSSSKKAKANKKKSNSKE